MGTRNMKNKNLLWMDLMTCVNLSNLITLIWVVISSTLHCGLPTKPTTAPQIRTSGALKPCSTHMAYHRDEKKR